MASLTLIALNIIVSMENPTSDHSEWVNHISEKNPLYATSLAFARVSFFSLQLMFGILIFDKSLTGATRMRNANNYFNMFALPADTRLK